MNINFQEYKSGLKNKIILNVVMDRLECECNDYLGIDIPDILLNPDNNKYKRIILDVLEKYGYNFNSFYNSELIDYAALNKNIITGGLLIKDVILNDKKILLITEHGNFEAEMLAESLNENNLIEKKGLGMLIGYCHQLTAEMLEKYKISALTALFPYDFCENIIHSFNIGNDGKVYDVSHNIIMEQDEYIKLFKPINLSSVTYEEYINSQELQDFKNNISSEYPLYNIARKRVKKRSMKDLSKV